MRIEAEKPTPKYLQLAEILKEHFKDLQYQPDQKIPTEDELIEQFQISRNTVRQALAELVNEGIIYKIQGSGSFLAGTAPEEPNRSYLIGVIVPRLSFYIYPQIIQGIDDVAHQKNYNIVLASSDVRPEKEQVCLDQLLEKKIDGLLIEPSGGVPQFETSVNFQRLKSLPIPVVFIDWELDDPAVSYVAPDDVEGSFRATNSLIEAGHRRIAWIGPNDNLPGIKRQQGYRKALTAHGLAYDPQLDKPCTIIKWNEPGGIGALVNELLDLGNARPTAIFFFNDDGALQGYDAIRAARLKIPADISVIGFDDVELAARADPPLTTILHPKYQIGKWAAEILFDSIEHPARHVPRQMLLSPAVVVRQSVKNVRA
jgi:GntR family transcriptional regulator, arabinose operon transcriptional repressor